MLRACASMPVPSSKTVCSHSHTAIPQINTCSTWGRTALHTRGLDCRKPTQSVLSYHKTWKIHAASGSNIQPVVQFQCVGLKWRHSWRSTVACPGRLHSLNTISLNKHTSVLPTPLTHTQCPYMICRCVILFHMEVKVPVLR